MKIEKLNENQIRCTLTKEDLASRQLKISELAYGTEKAKTLFRDMMRQANYEFGFEAEDIPLMIEAVPLNAECIVLIITKVEDPEELDTRFSRFAPSVHEDTDYEEDEDMADTSSDEVMDELTKINEEGTTIMLVTHDVKVAAKCSRVIYFVDGNIKGEYHFDGEDAKAPLRERERTLSNWLMEMGW